MDNSLKFDEAKSWPFAEARKIADRYKNSAPEKGYVLFETGYGPSGLPHIGTFGEVARTTMVRNAFEKISDIPTKLFCVSDDMDGLRKVPENLPNQEMITANLGKPLTEVPDPFETHDSFGAHMNAKLRSFLDGFEFDYEFKSATELYKNGDYDDALLHALKNYDKIMKVMLPTLGEERQKTYSPFLPISPKTGQVLYVPMKSVDAEAGTITFDDEDGEETTLPVTGGNCKLQWKPDFGMRWAALDVDFEMYGKDHLVNGKLYSKICRVLGGNPPVQFNFELFLDEIGQKISKSKGNGVSIDEWLKYASPESLAYYMFVSPQKAKKLYFDVIPKSVDEYLSWLKKYHIEPSPDNPVWHIHAGNPPKLSKGAEDITFALLVNLASACNPDDKSILWGFISKYAPEATPENSPILDGLADYAIRYYQDFVEPNKKFRAPSDKERAAFVDLADALDANPDGDAAELMQLAYDIGNKHEFGNMREWFSAIYEVLLGATQGPRVGSFFALFGAKESAALIREKIA